MKRMTLIGLSAAFALGVMSKSLVDGEALSFVSEAYAKVAGMDYWELRRDWDFKKAVKYIVERCSVDGEDISC